MVFIRTYEGAMRLLAQIEKGTCAGECRAVWMRNLKYALKTETNPLGLDKTQRKTMQAKIDSLSGRRAKKPETAKKGKAKKN